MNCTLSFEFRKLFYCLSCIFLLLHVLSCTNKDVRLVTNVEYEFTVDLEAEGFVGDALVLDIKATPEEVVDGFSYFTRIEIVKGNGKLEDNDGNSYPIGEDIELLEENNFSLSLFYIPTSSGKQKLLIHSRDNFEKSTKEEFSLTAKNIPFIWKASTDRTILTIGTEKEKELATVTVTLQKNENKEGISFVRNYSVSPPNSLRLSEQRENDVTTSVRLEEEQAILPGIYTYLIEPVLHEGIITLTLEAKNSNGQVIKRTLTFETNKEGIIDPNEEKSKENDVISFTLAGQIGTTQIDLVNHTVKATMAFDADLARLNPTIEVSPKATLNPATSQERDFSVPVVYTVTAENGTVQEWTVTIIREEDTRDNANDITSFRIDGITRNASLNDNIHTVTVTVPFNTDLTRLIPDITVSTHATITPPSREMQNFTSARTYTVTAENGDTQMWTVNVTKEPDSRSSNNDIIKFEVDKQVGISNINTFDHTVAITVPFDTDISRLDPTILVSDKATITPASGQAQNFSSPVIYTVTAENKTSQSWTVTVTKETPLNRPPVAVNDTIMTDRTGSIDIDILANDMDPDNDTLTITEVTQPIDGSTLIRDNKVHFSLTNTNDATYTFLYGIADGNGGTDIGTIVVIANICPPQPCEDFFYWCTNVCECIVVSREAPACRDL